MSSPHANESALQDQEAGSWSPLPPAAVVQVVSRISEEEEFSHTTASEAPLTTELEGFKLQLNPRVKSGYTRVESLPDGRFRTAVAKAARTAFRHALHASHPRVLCGTGPRRRAPRGAAGDLFDGSRGCIGLRPPRTIARPTSGPAVMSAGLPHHGPWLWIARPASEVGSGCRAAGRSGWQEARLTACGRSRRVARSGHNQPHPCHAAAAAAASNATAAGRG